jgi:hypothetical protein
MKLYKATYNIGFFETGFSPRYITQYVLAPDFQTAAKLAETSEEITSESGGSGHPIIGDRSNMLFKLEEIASEISDFQETANLCNIGSHMFSIVDKKLFKVDLLAVGLIQE